MKTKVLIFTLLLIGFENFGQQAAQYTQYMYNTINVNPAYAGSRGVMSIFGLHRTQWVGMDGAPVTNAFSVNSPIKNSNVGYGISFVNDRIGPTSENAIAVDASYTAKISEHYKLSVGLKGTANLFDLDMTKLKYEPSPSLVNYKSVFTPNVGAGIYLHSDKLYFGFSVPQFFETNRYNDNEVMVNKELKNFYLIGGYVFDLNPGLKFKPAFLTKVVEGAPLQLDVSGNFLINEKFVLGAAWRWDAAMSAMAGFQVSDQIYIGYGYDWETTALKHHNDGSHEIFLRFELFKNEKRIVSPRFF